MVTIADGGAGSGASATGKAPLSADFAGEAAESPPQPVTARKAVAARAADFRFRTLNPQTINALKGRYCYLDKNFILMVVNQKVTMLLAYFLAAPVVKGGRPHNGKAT